MLYQFPTIIKQQEKKGKKVQEKKNRTFLGPLSWAHIFKGFADFGQERPVLLENDIQLIWVAAGVAARAEETVSLRNWHPAHDGGM